MMTTVMMIVMVIMVMIETKMTGIKIVETKTMKATKIKMIKTMKTSKNIAAHPKHATNPTNSVMKKKDGANAKKADMNVMETGITDVKQKKNAMAANLTMTVHNHAAQSGETPSSHLAASQRKNGNTNQVPSPL